MKTLNILLFSLLSTCMSINAHSKEPSKVQSKEPIKVMIVGTYHFANPGLDIVKTNIDDVLLPKRQTEIQQVLDGLAQFKPTKIAVERNGDAFPNNALPSYQQFLSQDTVSNRNEITQIGFRLAKKMHHKEVFGIDVDGEFPFNDVVAYANKNGLEKEIQLILDEVKMKGVIFDEKVKKMSVNQILRDLNSPKEIKNEHQWYMKLFRFGAKDVQAGANVLSNWTKRNIEICARLVQQAQPGDRIVVLYGAGHNYLLRQCVSELSGWELVEANQYLPK